MREIKDKRFDEVFDLQMGKTPDRKVTQYFEGENVWVSIRDLVNKEICDSHEHISDEAVLKSGIKKVKKDTVIMSFKLTVGKCAIATTDLYTNEAIMAFNIKDGFEISPSFLYYYLQSYKWQGANKAVMGITLNKATISKQKITVPSLAIQEAIVAELDKLSEVIEKKKKQVKELDALAQAIFYDMFGDPVENEKGWEVKKIGEVGELIRGGGFLKSDFVENGIPCIHYGQIHMKFGRFIHRHITEISEAVAKKSKKASDGDVILAITSEDVEGSCKCTAWVGGYEVCVGAHAAIYKHNQNPIYISYYISSSRFQVAKQKYVHGIKVMEIKPSDIEKIDIMLPPLALQQTFAAKIEAIEQQKALINQSIQEAQTLFDARMDYWFGE